MMGAQNITLWGLVATVLASLLGGGLLGVWLRYRLGTKKLDAEAVEHTRQQARLDFETLLRVVTGQRDEAYRKIERYDEKILALEMEVQGLRLTRDLDPFPNWIVDLEGDYIFLNREFEKTFLEPVELNYRDMIGQQHKRVFPPDFVKKLALLDQQARSRPDKQARMTTTLDSRQVTVHKFAICVKGVPVAFAGYITEMDGVGE